MTGLSRKPGKVLVIGSGPIIIGQAAEFDYAGTQACKALREEGVTTVLVNSNPATIMTDNDIADRVYIEPLTVSVLERVIDRERPDGLLPTLGGQTGLNLAVALYVEILILILNLLVEVLSLIVFFYQWANNIWISLQRFIIKMHIVIVSS